VHSEVKHVFVYGTLRKDRGAYRNFGLDRHANYVGTFEVKGWAMYHLGGFPGVRQGDEQSVIIGDLLEITNPEIMKSLDRYEGYYSDAPDNSLYLRKEIEVDGKQAFIYEYNRQPNERYRISGGEWV